MARASNRDKILRDGLRVVHERGYGGASVRDIVQAAGVPQGSFTNHFGSKEAFGLEILNLYFANSRDVIARTLRDDALPPLDRLRAYIQANKDHLQQGDMRNGCLLGNFSAEVVDHSESIRGRLVEIFAEVAASVTYCLKAAVDAGELSAETDADALGSLIVSSLQGSILVAKTQRDPAAIDVFETLLFSTILQRPRPTG